MVAARRPKLSAGRHDLLIFQHPVWAIPQLCLFKLQTRAYRPEASSMS
uniref:Upstream transcription factor 2 n=1 Tax=Mus musculus TaxID=10090 RepID=E9PZY3_MOUSE